MWPLGFWTQVPIVCPGVGTKVVEEVVLVVEVVRVVFDPATLDDAEPVAGADEDIANDEPPVDVEATVEDIADEVIDELGVVPADDDATEELLVDNDEDADDDDTDCEALTCEKLGVETATGDVVAAEEKTVAVVIIEALLCATTAGFNLYMLRRPPLPQISELFPAQGMEQSLCRVAFTAPELSVEPHQHSEPYSRPA
ncbi:MAG: hypothetical protein M1830_000683 [Pleopsidium flavum]|nr:MAG: hypothetical protein M1830_000683 [Pleopsidium flavum]